MLRNYFKTALRNLIKQKIYTIINILGLAVSISACLLLVLYVKYELSYDSFFPDADRIYKMVLERKYPNHITYYASIPHSYATVTLKDFPEVENSMIMFNSGDNVIVKYKVNDNETKTFEEDYFMFADSAFFSFFDVKLLKGDKQTAMTLPNQVIVSETTAKRFFGETDPMNKIISADFGELKVTGVFKDVPLNSHIRFDAMVSFSGEELRKQENYTSFDSYAYLKLKPGADAKALEAKFPKMVDTYASGEIERDLNQSWEDYKKAGNGYRYFLQPLKSIHLDPTNLEFTNTPSGNINYINVLGFIAILILAIACINFVNLATARSAARAREVGLRKVMGSIKNQLIGQFLVESILLSFFGTVLAIGGALLLLPSFNALVEKQLHVIFSPDLIAGLVGFAILVGALAGLYPAFVLSSYNPVEVMKANFTGNSKGTWLRNGLVVFQFIISIILIVGTVVVREQMAFVQRKDLGFDKDQVLMLERAWALEKRSETFIEELKKLPEVSTAAGTTSRVGNRDDFFGQMFQPEGSSEILTVKSMYMDDDFAELIGFKLKDGRFFSKDTQDSLNILLNETAAKTLNLSDPVGKRLVAERGGGGNNATGRRVYTIIGVINNFHFQSLRDEITPLVIFSKETWGQHANTPRLAIKFKANESQAGIEKVTAKWKEFVPERPIHYEFLGDNLNQGYAEEQRSGKMFTVFSGLAIVIACVGLFGLSAYTASQRTKEIGIRKILGASVGGVVLLLTRDFTKLVLIAFIIATPAAWWTMDQWLGSFAYKIVLGAGSFLLAGAVALGIAWLTVSYQSIKAAVMNPVKSLKSE